MHVWYSKFRIQSLLCKNQFCCFKIQYNPIKKYDKIWNLTAENHSNPCCNELNKVQKIVLYLAFLSLTIVWFFWKIMQELMQKSRNLCWNCYVCRLFSITVTDTIYRRNDVITLRKQKWLRSNYLRKICVPAIWFFPCEILLKESKLLEQKFYK